MGQTQIGMCLHAIIDVILNLVLNWFQYGFRIRFYELTMCLIEMPKSKILNSLDPELDSGHGSGPGSAQGSA